MVPFLAAERLAPLILAVPVTVYASVGLTNVAEGTALAVVGT